MCDVWVNPGFEFYLQEEEEELKKGVQKSHSSPPGRMAHPTRRILRYSWKVEEEKEEEEGEEEGEGKIVPLRFEEARCPFFSHFEIKRFEVTLRDL